MHKWHAQVEKDMHQFMNENKFKKTIIREAFHLYAKENNKAILKANSLSPSPRQLDTIRSDTKMSEGSKYTTITSNLNSKTLCREEVKKNYRKRIYRNRSQMQKV
jgi:hypothetical protein